MILADFYAFLVSIDRIGTDSVMLCGRKIGEERIGFLPNPNQILGRKTKKLKNPKFFVIGKIGGNPGLFLEK